MAAISRPGSLSVPPLPRAVRAILTSVRVRLTLWYVAILALVLVTFSAGVYTFLVRSIDADIANVVQGYQQTFTREARSSQALSNLMPHFRYDPNTQVPVVSVMVEGSNGGEQHIGTIPSALSSNMVRALFQHYGGCERQKSGQHVYDDCTWPVRTGNEVNAVGVQLSLDSVQRAQDRLRTALLLGIPISLLIALAGGWVLASRALSPVDDLRRTAESITATDLSRRIDLRRDDELGRLAATFDDMIQRLDMAFREQRQLAADVSHELRTPLAVIQAQASLALKRTRTPDEYAAVLGSIQEETGRMSRIVADLLLLARAESGQEIIEREPVRLDRVAEWGVDQVRSVAGEKRLHLRLAAQPVVVDGDPDRLRQLVLNLIDNAIKYTPIGGHILVVVRVLDNQALLSVVDTGEGMAPEALPHIFQRFYRADRARTRREGGSGLGLAIAHRIVLAHDGTIDVRSQPGQGSVFTVRLPLLAAREVETVV